MLVGLTKLIQELVTTRREPGEDHPAIVRMRFPLCPSLPGKDIHIESRRTTGNRKPACQLGRGNPCVTYLAQLDQRSEGAGCQVEIGERIGRDAIESSGGPQELHECAETQAVF